MKMQCVECKNVVHVGKVASWRSGRTNSRCYNCGCPALEPYVKPAVRREQENQQADPDPLLTFEEFLAQRGR